ncbi:MAG: zinc-ribbon domain-containing protein, partial [Cryobacterium sp.]|nr:zinc-ribbon domain-containing protein [Cryobacterium sp.]
MTFCTECGAENSTDARFCDACGRPLAASSPTTPTPQVPLGPPRPCLRPLH